METILIKKRKETWDEYKTRIARRINKVIDDKRKFDETGSLKIIVIATITEG